MNPLLLRVTVRIIPQPAPSWMLAPLGTPNLRRRAEASPGSRDAITIFGLASPRPGTTSMDSTSLGVIANAIDLSS